MNVRDYFDTFRLVWEAFFSDAAAFTILFFLALVVIFTLEEDRRKQRMYAVYPLISVALVLSPVIYVAVKIVFGAEEVAYMCRFFLIAPMVFTAAYGVLLVLGRAGEKKLVVSLAVMAALLISGRGVDLSHYETPENPEHVPQEVIDFSEMLDGRENKRALATVEDLGFVRLVDASITLCEGRNHMGIYSSFEHQLDSEDPNVEEITSVCIGRDCHYLLCRHSDMAEEKYTDLGAEIIGYTGEYMVVDMTPVLAAAASNNSSS